MPDCYDMVRPHLPANKMQPTRYVQLVSATTVFVVALHLSQAFYPLEALASQRERPNIIVILADDLGWRDLQCYGSTFYETPHIDRLAERGLRFTNAYSSSPLCSPTRASLLTGLYPTRHGITTPSGHVPQVVLKPSLPKQAPPTRRVFIPRTATRLRPELITYAEVLKGVGYRTAFMGKWHLGRDPYLPEQQGFDVVVGGRGFPGPPGGYFAPWPIDTLPKVPPGTHIDDVVTDQAIQFIRECREHNQPFLLNLWYYSVHAPFEAKQRLIEKYRRKAERQPDNPQASPIMAAMIETLDTNVGRVMKAIHEADLDGNSIVLFTSDNGGNEYNLAGGVQVTDNTPLRNGKGNIHEGGHRVPMIAVWPGHVAPAGRCESLVTSVDFFPSVIELAGAELPEQQHCDGVSFAQLLREGKPLKTDRAILTFFPHDTPATGSRPAVAARQGKWVVIRFFGDGDMQRDRFALYDIEQDIGQQHDLSREHPDVVRELASFIEQQLAASQAVVPQPNPNWKPDADGWQGNQFASLHLDRVAGTLVIESTGNDPSMRSLQRVPAGRITLQLRMRSSATNHDARFYFGGAKEAFAKERSIGFHTRGTSEWATYEVTFESKTPVAKLRFDPASGRGRFEIDYLRVISWRDEETGRVVKHWDF